MEVPSMVERADGRLVVRSLVSGATVYQTAMESVAAKAATERATNSLTGSELLERQLQLLSNAAAQPMPLSLPLPFPLPQLAASTSQNLGAAAVVQLDTSGEDDLPQCKIRRNYSCNACAFFTQNPRIHLSHLRDVHGEKIVINECKLCLYASRHFQKLVRHMKMVHGCSDDDSGGGIVGRRHCNREARKRRLEESIEQPGGPSLKQLKCELQQQEQQLLTNVEAFNRQKQLQHLQHLVDNSSNLFSMAFELQMCMLQPQTMMGFSGRTEEAAAEGDNSSSDSEELPQVDDCLMPEPLDLTAGAGSNMHAPYRCQKCSYSTPIRARFKKHVKYHSMPLIKCNSCDFHSPYKWNLDRHTKNHGANGFFKCVVCDFSTNIKQSLTIHELNHHVPQRRDDAEDPSPPPTPSVLIPKLEQTESKPCSSPLKDQSPPLSDLPAINCSHCQQRVPNAMELVGHLQRCEPALRNTTQLACDMELAAEEDYRAHNANDLSYCGVETAPGYGEITEQLQPEDMDALKKVFKCPHCTFWAATASRFHVHIVGHLNRKPFECSLCSYRSNWRWDITKHIRLKAMRDKSHLSAQVLMNDETGRRNYAKYNQYLTLMKVNAEQAADAKTMRCGEMHTSNAEPNMQTVSQLEEEAAAIGLEPQPEQLAALDLSKPNVEQNMPVDVLNDRTTEGLYPAVTHKQKHKKNLNSNKQKLHSGKSKSDAPSNKERH